MDLVLRKELPSLWRQAAAWGVYNRRFLWKSNSHDG